MYHENLHKKQIYTSEVLHSGYHADDNSASVAKKYEKHINSDVLAEF